MLSEISQVMKEKYDMISPISETQSTKQTSKQNISRDIEIKYNLIATRGEVGGNYGGKKGRVFRNKYKGRMDKTKVGWKQGREEGMARVVVGGECRQLSFL